MIEAHTGRRLAAVLILPLLVLTAQPGRGEGPLFDRNRAVHLEHVIYASHSDSAQVDIHYRLSKNFFVMVKSDQQAGTFRGRGELVVEVLNEQSYAVAREIRPVALVRTGTKDDPIADLQDILRFRLPKGTFRVIFEVKDLESGRTSTERNHRITVRPVPAESLCVSSGFLFELPQSGYDASRIEAANYGGASVYGNRGGVMIQLPEVVDTESISVSWELKGIEDEDEQIVRQMSGTSITKNPGALELLPRNGKIGYHVTGTTGSVIAIPLPVERLEPGAYQALLTITQGTSRVTQPFPFRVIWPNRPQSLGIMEIAIDAMRHIASAQEFDEMTSFSSSRGQKAFHDFWRRRDPDTTTVYNETMAEYFRRVDEAIKRFSTPNETDGYKTDRGKILVLFGTPERTERMFRPSINATEVWYYPRAGKRFIFSDPNKTGNYILSGTEPM